MKLAVIAMALASALPASACTTAQRQSMAPAWQRNACSGLPDKADYDRCTARLNDGRRPNE